MAEKEIKAKRSNRQKTLDMVYIAIFAVIIAVCSWISVPMVVPFTLQTFGVFCAVGLLGGKRGTLSVLIYVLLGAVGVPVFAGFSSGIGTLFGVTGGYIMGFIFTAPLTILVAPFPFLMLTKRIGEKEASFGSLLGTLLVYIISSPVSAIMYCLLFGITGLMFGILSQRMKDIAVLLINGKLLLNR